MIFMFVYATLQLHYNFVMNFKEGKQNKHEVHIYI
jgi:hypothetical protein